MAEDIVIEKESQFLIKGPNCGQENNYHFVMYYGDKCLNCDADIRAIIKKGIRTMQNCRLVTNGKIWKIQRIRDENGNWKDDYETIYNDESEALIAFKYCLLVEKERLQEAKDEAGPFTVVYEF